MRYSESYYNGKENYREKPFDNRPRVKESANLYEGEGWYKFLVTGFPCSIIMQLYTDPPLDNCFLL